MNAVWLSFGVTKWEHTVLVTDSGFEVLTLRPSERAAFERFVDARRGV